MTDGSGTSSYTIDSLHRITQAINGAGQTVTYGYDIKSQLTLITYPGGINKVTRTYDAAGRLATVVDWLHHTTTYNYDADSNLVKEIYPNGVTANLTPDLADRIMAITIGTTKTTFQTLTYGRDANNNLCNVGSATCGTGPGSLSPYDSLDRQAVAPLGGSYGLDTAGNVTQIALSPYTTTQVFDAAEQLATRTKMNGGTLVQRLTYVFDTNGNRTQQTDQNNVSTNFSYDQANRLTRYNGTTATYIYNGDGLRTSKTVSGVLESYVWNMAQPTSAPLVDGTTSYVTGFGGLPLEQISSNGTYYYHQDQLGSTVDVTDSRGGVVDAYKYESYGVVMTCSPCSVANPLQFAGQYVDSESGLQYLRARYYEPSTGLFLTEDPMDHGAASPYRYAAGSPQNVVDPSGMCTSGSAHLFIFGVELLGSGNCYDNLNNFFGAQTPGDNQPDYYHFSLSFGVLVQGGVSVDFTKDHLYIEPGYGVGLGPPVEVQMGGGKLHQKDPDQNTIDTFVSAWTLKLNAGFVGGASTVWGNEGQWNDNALGNEINLQSPGLSLMQSYAFQVG